MFAATAVERAGQGAPEPAKPEAQQTPPCTAFGAVVEGACAPAAPDAAPEDSAAEDRAHACALPAFAEEEAEDLDAGDGPLACSLAAAAGLRPYAVPPADLPEDAAAPPAGVAPAGDRGAPVDLPGASAACGAPGAAAAPDPAPVGARTDAPVDLPADAPIDAPARPAPGARKAAPAPGRAPTARAESAAPETARGGEPRADAPPARRGIEGVAALEEAAVPPPREDWRAAPADSAGAHPPAGAPADVRPPVAERAQAPDRPEALPAPPEPGAPAQLARSAIGALERGESEFRLRLRPEGMGELAVTIRARDRALSLNIRASSAPVRELILGQVDDLRACLAQGDCRLGGLSVEVDARGHGGAASSAFAQRDGNREPPRRPREAPPPPAGTATDRAARAGAIMYRI